MDDTDYFTDIRRNAVKEITQVALKVYDGWTRQCFNTS